MQTQGKISNTMKYWKRQTGKTLKSINGQKSASKLLFVKNEFCNILKSSFLITFANLFQIVVPISLYRSQI